MGTSRTCGTGLERGTLTLPDVFVFEDVERFERDAERLQDLHQLSREAALGRRLAALHEDHHRRFVHQLFQTLVQILTVRRD